MLLRDGSTNIDSRLDRLVRFDEASRQYPIRTLVKTFAPRSYTWAVGTWLDQGAEGACVGFAVTHELLARPKPVVGLDARFARERIYWTAQRTDPWDGGSYPGASPFYEGTSVLDGVKAAKAVGYITEYRWAFGLEDLILAVGYKGPAVLGVNWYEGMSDPDANGFLRPTGTLLGGHAILCHSVNIKGKYFWVWNSWGELWGINGRAKISFEDMSRLLSEEGEACIPVTRSLTPVA